MSLSTLPTPTRCALNIQDSTFHVRYNTDYLSLSRATRAVLQVVLENKGDIEAAYSLVPPDTLFGPKFTFAPSSGVLRSEGLQAIQVCVM